MSNIIKQDNSGNAPVYSLQRQIDNLFSDFLRDFDVNIPTRSGLVKTFQPKVNIAEDDKAYYIDAELAGVKKDHIKLEYHDDKTLTISAEKHEESKESRKNYHRIESSYGSFFRSFYLPDNVDNKSISAEMKDGILKLVLPKTTKSESKANLINIK